VEIVGESGPGDGDDADLATRTAAPEALIEPPAPTPADVLPRGTVVGRYLLVEPVGEGGMGVVYRAFDPELDRAVAVKLIRSAAGPGSDEARARLLREAQAMARLAHPNVVAVHDVGTFGDQVFVAMELLSGQTVRGWLQQRRPWREVARVFADAGRGLAAAHRAGLVHRDFKPANAFLEDSGRVRLLDFGLARPALPAVPGVAPAAPPGSDDDSTHTPPSHIYASITRDGRTAGTPRYMAPEQRTGDASPHSDQYAFCVALCEALFRRRAAPDLAERDLRGPGPRGLRRLVARGLRADPSLRWPSMDAVVARLDRLRDGRRHAIAAAGLATIAAVALAVAGRGDDPGDRCAHAADGIAGVWSPAVAGALRTAFVATGRSHAADTATRVIAGVDRYARAWADARRDACEATWVRGEQSQELLDRRMACLDRRLAGVRAYAGVLTGGATSDLVDRAVPALPAPGDLATCADREALEADGPWPTSAETRAGIAREQARLEEVWSLRFAARHDEALRLAGEVLAAGRAMSHPPLVAEALYVTGAVQQAAGDAAAARATLDAAIAAAAAARQPALLARAGALQVYVVGDLLGAADESIGLAALARAQATMVGDPPATVAALRNNLGNVYYWKGRYDDAEREYAAALAIESAHLGPDHLDVAWSWSNLGSVRAARGASTEARPYAEKAVAIAEAALGPDHPDLAPFLNNLAGLLVELGEPAAARGHVARAIRLVEAAQGRRQRRVAELLQTLGSIADAQGQPAEALAACDEALAIDRGSLDPAHLAIAYSLTCRGRALIGLGRGREALADLERARAIVGERSEDPVEGAELDALLADALWQSGLRAPARVRATAARDAYRALSGRARDAAAADTWLAEHR
jgi:tetratricopeptide (TPR) repeat protein